MPTTRTWPKSYNNAPDGLQYYNLFGESHNMRCEIPAKGRFFGLDPIYDMIRARPIPYTSIRTVKPETLMQNTDPRLQGYQHWEGIDPFEDYVGPLYYKPDPRGGYRCAFIIEEKHINGQRGLHGGMMMTFADYALFMIARDHLGEDSAVTVSFNSDFCSRGELGEFVESTGEVVHASRKMLFVRGTVFTGERVILRYAGVLKRVGKREKKFPKDVVWGE